jgi:hypothetical protein
MRKLQRDMIAAGAMSSPYVFVSERGSPLSVAGYQRMYAARWLRLQARQ